MNKLIWRKLCILFFMVTILGGCTKTVNSVPDKPKSGSNKLSGEITFLAPDTKGNFFDKDIKDVIAKGKSMVETKHPGTKVNVVFANLTDYNQKLDKMFAEGNPPDIIMELNMPYLEKKGYALDLTPYFKTDNMDLNTIYTPNVIDIFTINKKMIGVPANIDPLAVGFNKTWFDKAGLAYPKDDWTWEDFLDTALKLKAANNNKSSVITPYNLNFVELLALSKGEHFINQDGMTSKGSINSIKSIEAFRWASDLFNIHKVTDIDTMKKGSQQLVNGQIGMVVSELSFLQNLYNQKKDEISVVGLPKFKAGVPVNNGSVMGVGITANSKSPKLAWEFLKTFEIDVNEISIKMYDLGLAFSIPLAKNKGNANEKFTAIRVNEMNHFVKTAATVNKDWDTLVRTHLNKDIQKFLEPEIDLNKELSLLADQIDPELLKLSKE